MLLDCWRNQHCSFLQNTGQDCLTTSLPWQSLGFGGASPSILWSFQSGPNGVSPLWFRCTIIVHRKSLSTRRKAPPGQKAARFHVPKWNILLWGEGSSVHSLPTVRAVLCCCLGRFRCQTWLPLGWGQSHPAILASTVSAWSLAESLVSSRFAANLVGSLTFQKIDKQGLFPYQSV